MALLKTFAALMSALLLVQSPRASEHQLKAVFLFNFAQFVDWQSVAAQDPRTASGRFSRLSGTGPSSP